MEHAQWIHHFGYLALFVGTFFEGESVLLLVAYLAANGTLRMSLTGIVITSTLGAYVGHLVFFWLGRTQGEKLIARFPSLRLHADRARAFFKKYGSFSIFIAQYLYGLRIAFAIMLGLSHFSWKRFLTLMLLSSALWAILFTAIGTTFGLAIHQFLGRHKWVEWAIGGGILLIAVLLAMYHAHADRQARQKLSS